MILEFKSTLPGGSGERIMVREVEEVFGSMSVEDVLITVVSKFLTEDIKSANRNGKWLEVDLSESRTYYDCSEAILERVINHLSEQGVIQIVNAKRIKKGRRKAVLTMNLTAVD